MDTSSSVTVIGGGVIGLSCGWRLARAGLRVTLLAANQTMPRASAAALGVLTPATPLGDFSLHRLHRESLAMFDAFARELEADAGLPIGHLHCGSLRLSLTEAQYAERRKEAEAVRAQQWQVDGRPALELLSAEACRRLEPALQGTVYGALYNRVAARIQVDSMLQALRQACLAAGVTIREDCPVKGIDIQARQVQGIRTPDGPLPCHKLVVCAGVWTGRLHPLLDEFSRMEPVRGQSLVVETERPLLEHILHRNEAYLVPQEGCLLVLGSTTEAEAGFDTRTSLAGIHQVLGSSLEALPTLGRASIQQLRAGLRPRAPDEKPYLGPIPGAEGLWVATGHYKTGFGFAPLTAEAITELVLSGRSRFDLTSCSPRRQPA